MQKKKMKVKANSLNAYKSILKKNVIFFVTYYLTPSQSIFFHFLAVTSNSIWLK